LNNQPVAIATGWQASTSKGWQQQLYAVKPAQAKDCDSIVAEWQ